MDKIFLDTNLLIDIWEHRKEVNLKDLSANHLFASPLSVHIYMYTYDMKTPLPEIHSFLEKMKINLISFDTNILKNALHGPTTDLEDNIQLHSAIEANADYFLTSDKKILKMKFFGKTEIVNKLNK